MQFVLVLSLESFLPRAVSGKLLLPLRAVLLIKDLDLEIFPGFQLLGETVVKSRVKNKYINNYIYMSVLPHWWSNAFTGNAAENFYIQRDTVL